MFPTRLTKNLHQTMYIISLKTITSMRNQFSVLMNATLNKKMELSQKQRFTTMEATARSQVLETDVWMLSAMRSSIILISNLNLHFTRNILWQKDLLPELLLMSVLFPTRSVTGVSELMPILSKHLLKHSLLQWINWIAYRDPRHARMKDY